MTADAWADRAAAFYGEQLKSDFRNRDYRIGYAEAQAMRREFEAALVALQEGWELEQLPVYRSAIAQVCGLWVMRSGTLDAPQRLALIDRGLAFDAQNDLVLRSMLDDRAYDAAERVLPATAPVEGAIARAMAECVYYSRRGNAPRVRQELSRAVELRPDMTIATAANLATLWAYSDLPDKPAAEHLAAAMLDLRPGDAIAQRTQGLVLSRMGEDATAVPLLEKVLDAMPDDRAVHSALAASYGRIGDLSKAEKHRQLGSPATQHGHTR